MLPVRPAFRAGLAVLLTAAASAAQQPPAAQPPATPPQPPAATPAAAPAAPAAEMKTEPAKEPKWPTEVAGKKLADWIGEMKSPDPTARDTAVKAIPLFGPDARKLASKPLLAAIEDPDPGIRMNAMTVIAGLGFDSKEDIHRAAEAMRAAIGRTVKGSMIRLHASRTLALLGVEAHGAMPGIVQIVTEHDPSWETRQAAAAALGRIGVAVYDEAKTPAGAAAKAPTLRRPVSKLAMSTLANVMLKDESSSVRSEACQALLVLGPPNNPDPAGYIKDVKPYLDVLAARMKDERDSGVRVWLFTLTMMYDDRAIDPTIPKVAGFVGSTDLAVRVQALNALAILGPRAKPALEQVRQALGQPELAVTVAAVTCLIAMGDAARPAIPDVEKLRADAKDAGMKKWYGEAVDVLKNAKAELPPPPKKDEPKKP